MLDVEAALARAQARAGLVPEEDAEAIAAACRADRFDLAALGADAAAAGNPVVPLVRALGEAVAGPAAAHRPPRGDEPGRARLGRDARRPSRAGTAAGRPARGRRSGGGAGRGPPRDADGRAHAAAAGAAGDLRPQGGDLAGRPGRGRRATGHRPLRAPGRPARRRGGHARGARRRRDRGARPARPRARPGRARAPLAHDAHAPGRAGRGARRRRRARSPRWRPTSCCSPRPRSAKLREGVAGRGGSSTLPHKRNPVAATCARACAMRAPGLVATLLGAMAHEHERAAGRVARRVAPAGRPADDDRARPPPGCATAWSTSRSTPRGCAPTST